MSSLNCGKCPSWAAATAHLRLEAVSIFIPLSTIKEASTESPNYQNLNRKRT